MQNNNPENKSNNFLFSQTRISPRQLSKDYIILVALLFSNVQTYCKQVTCLYEKSYSFFSLMEECIFLLLNFKLGFLTKRL